MMWGNYSKKITVIFAIVGAILFAILGYFFQLSFQKLVGTFSNGNADLQVSYYFLIPAAIGGAIVFAFIGIFWGSHLENARQSQERDNSRKV